MAQPKHSSALYKVGQYLTNDEVKLLTGGPVKPGWYTTDNQTVYICDGCHKDGYWGYRVLQLGGLQ